MSNLIQNSNVNRYQIPTKNLVGFNEPNKNKAKPYKKSAEDPELRLAIIADLVRREHGDDLRIIDIAHRHDVSVSLVYSVRSNMTMRERRAVEGKMKHEHPGLLPCMRKESDLTFCFGHGCYEQLRCRCSSYYKNNQSKEATHAANEADKGRDETYIEG